jgi:S-adenosylmethionine hydrolase
VTLLTDFGLDDAYVGMVKGAILAVHPDARLVDLSHAIPPQDVAMGALLLADAYPTFPPGTVHLAVVDPGVGTGRRGLLVSADGHYFVGPDNGLLGFCFERPGATAVSLTATRYHRQPTSRTFHARDVFGPVAAHCARGVALSRFGPRVTDPVRLPGEPRRLGRGGVAGRILRADRFGNLLTDLRGDELPDRPARCRLTVGGARIVGLSETYADRPRGSLGAVVDSSGRIEVFVREGSAQARLGVGPGSPVSLRRSSTSRSMPPGSGSAKKRRLPERSPRSQTTHSIRRPSSRSPAPRPSSPTRRPSFAPPTGSRSRTSRRP